MSFHKASKVGDILYIKARVTRVFGKSLEVHVKVLSFDGNCTQFSNASYFRFLTMDADEKQVVPVAKQVQPISDQE
jgi:acyl-CoA hydrolase